LSSQPDSLRAGGVRCVVNAAESVVTAFQIAQGPWQKSCEGGIRSSMLPGFRFLFAAIVLSTSMLVFGLGATALLRAAHEEFASSPPWQAPPETVFAGQIEATRPVLALLRVEPPVVEKAPELVPAAAMPAEPPAIVSTPAEPAVNASTPAEPAAAVSTLAEPEKIVALKTEDAPPPEPAKSEIPAAESPGQSETAPAPADAPAAADETKIAATEQATEQVSPAQVPPAQVLSAANEAAPVAAEPATPEPPASEAAASEQVSPPVPPQTDSPSTKIATLGGPAVTISVSPPAKTGSAKPDPSAINKRRQAQRAAQRRRAAARARLAQQAPQQPANPFAQPLTPVRSH
jgi:hypothetical protein